MPYHNTFCQNIIDNTLKISKIFSTFFFEKRITQSIRKQLLTAVPGCYGLESYAEMGKNCQRSVLVFELSGWKPGNLFERPVKSGAAVESELFIKVIEINYAVACV